MRIIVQEASFDVGTELNRFSETVTGAGAVVSFNGIVRDDTGDLRCLRIEHYPGMTERSLTAQAQQAKDRFGLSDVMVIHRFGDIAVAEPIMMVAAASRHRKAAFQGADFLMDYLKSRAPFWKQEITHSGSSWIQAKDADEQALADWGDQPG